MADLLTPGIYERVPAEVYHALPYCSNSRLSLLKRSPAHLRADLDNPGEPTDAMRLGSAIHMAVLEPDVFATTYHEAGQCEGVLKSGARKGEQCTNTGTGRWGGQWFCGQHKGNGEADAIEVLSRADFLVCNGIRRSLWTHPKLRKLMDAAGREELTVIWDDSESGVRCKARVDRLVEDFGGVVLDLKTTTDARPHAFERKVFEFGYFRQKPLYQDALWQCGIETKHCVIAAAEKEDPYAVAGYRLADGAADAGREELRKLLALYAKCEREKSWPAYPFDITEISLPRWGWDQLEAAS